MHNTPRFQRDPQSAYAQIVYASKSTDVTDVMINGKWVMRSRQLLTLKEEELIRNSLEYARRIDTFLIQREKSVMSKLIAIGGAMEEKVLKFKPKSRSRISTGSSSSSSQRK